MLLLQALVCLFLFTLANVIKAFIAKLIATHFHKEQYFERMQAALRKVRRLAPHHPDSSVQLINIGAGPIASVAHPWSALVLVPLPVSHVCDGWPEWNSAGLQMHE